ncbi:MAG: hypothetical protein ABR987_03375 [Terracidiphilus sp.]|jgi:hypothetical protein
MKTSRMAGKGIRAMEQFLNHRRKPELKQVVAEASRALAQLDAQRLDELAHSCRALNRELAGSSGEDCVQFALQAREAAEEMAVFAKVLDVTRANLNVIQRLLDLRAGRLEYLERPVVTKVAWGSPESRHGDN